MQELSLVEPKCAKEFPGLWVATAGRESRTRIKLLIAEGAEKIRRARGEGQKQGRVLGFNV